MTQEYNLSTTNANCMHAWASFSIVSTIPVSVRVCLWKEESHISLYIPFIPKHAQAFTTEADRLTKWPMFVASYFYYAVAHKLYLAYL